MKAEEVKDNTVVSFNDGVIGEIRNVRPKPGNPERTLYDIFIFASQSLSEGFEVPSLTTQLARVLSEEEIWEEVKKVLVEQTTNIENAESKVRTLEDHKKATANWLEKRWVQNAIKEP